MKNFITVFHFTWGVILFLIGILCLVFGEEIELIYGWFGIVIGALVILLTLSRLKARGKKLLSKEDSLFKKIRCFFLVFVLLILIVIFISQLLHIFY